MARVTVEDCIDKVPNRFDLVVLAAHRARLLASGATRVVERDNDKNPVVALRELASGKLSEELLDQSLITSFQKYGSINSQGEDGHAEIVEDRAEDESENLSEEDALEVMVATGMTTRS